MLLKSGDVNNGVVEKEPVFKISVSGEALIPGDFMENQDDRLFFYRKLSLSSDCKEVDLVDYEVRDRFGLPPTSLRLLFLIKKIRLLSLNTKLLFLKTNEVGVDLLFNLFKKEDVIVFVKKASFFFNDNNIVFSIQNSSTGLTLKIESSGVEKSLSSVVGLLNFLKNEK